VGLKKGGGDGGTYWVVGSEAEAQAVCLVQV